MAVLRIEKTKDYTIMSNHHLRDRSLSLKAKGLVSLMLSLPENWEYSLSGLACICDDGIGSVRSGIAEIEKRGYLTRRRIREANGQLGDMEYTIHEVPQKPDEPEADNSPVDNSDSPVDNSPPVCEKPTPKKPICENPTQALPTYGNSTQLSNTSNQKLKEKNTHEETIHQSIRGADAPDRMEAMEIYRQILKENIAYDSLCYDHRHSIDEIDELLELMLETVCSTKKTMRVDSEDKPAELVKSRMLKLDQFHIEYCLEALGKNTTGVRNIKNYLLTTLYNAPSTIGNHYKQMVQHDLYGDKQ